ncbi:hypothetical protein [Spirillospora albida]|uniref:hypothetical protein n=1 Tax=Spirillospora albida TaxID=58123 RepID=UPI0004C17770|nr:hypothetical protein [Spirillospora albida]
MQQRAIDVVLAAATGTALAGVIGAGVAAAAGDTAPAEAEAPATVDAPQAKAAAKSAGNAVRDAVAPRREKALLTGTTTASYFWDDGSGVNGDTGAPASGRPMRRGMFASPSWPLLTKVRVTYRGRSVIGFVGDRGPGAPSHAGIMLDLDTYTFRYLLDGRKPASRYTSGTGEGHLERVRYEVLAWGKGAGERGAPRPFGG